MPELLARSADPDLDQNSRQSASFDSRLAMVYTERLLNEQSSSARASVEAGLQELPENSQARKAGQALLAIAEKIPEAQSETRQALEDFFESLALQQQSHATALAVLERLLASGDNLLLGYVVRMHQEGSFDRRVADALEPDPEVSARARRQIEDGLPGASSADFNLAKTEVFEAVRTEILKLDNPAEAVQLHAEGRLRAAFTVLELIDTLKEQGKIEPGTPVAVAGASFQLGNGLRAEESEAAHKLAGQVYIGIDGTAAASRDQDQLRQHRLDTLLASDSKLLKLAQVQAASTTVLPSYVNNADSLWESKGLRDALEGAVSNLLNESVSDPGAVARAFETFRGAAAEAIQAAAEHNRAKLEQLDAQQAQAAATQAMERAQLARMQEVIELYQATLAQADAQQMRLKMLEYLAIVADRSNQK